MKKVLALMVLLTVWLDMSAQWLPGNIVGKILPYTWETPFANGKIINTMVEDGTIYSQSITPCVLCSTSGMCQVCHGTGGQFWPGMGIQPCTRCLGSRRCAGCFGRGFSIMNYTTSRFGGTIGYDEHGNVYVSSTSSGDGGSSRSTGRKPSIYNCCSGVPTFGYQNKHTCRNCGEYHYIGSHKCIRK